MQWLKQYGTDLLFLLIVIIYVAFIRQWPFGDTLQTAADIAVVVGSIITLRKYFVCKTQTVVKSSKKNKTNSKKAALKK